MLRLIKLDLYNIVTCCGKSRLPALRLLRHSRDLGIGQLLVREINQSHTIT